MSPFYSLIGQNNSITAGANSGMYDRSAQARNQIMAQWHDSIEREKQRKFQEEQADKARKEARKDFWTGKAVDLGTGIAGGAIIGGMAAGMEGAGAMAGEGVDSVVAGTPAVSASLEPALETGGSIGTIGEGVATPVSSVISKSPTLATAARSSVGTMGPKMFGGSVGRGALLGGILGGAGGLGGQNYLGTALAASNTANDNALGWTQLGLNQARMAANEGWRQKEYDERVAHNLENETDQARHTDAYVDWMKRRTTAPEKPKSSLSMTVGADGGRTLKGNPDEVTDWMNRNPSGIGTGPAADPVPDTVSRIEYMLQTNPKATEDDVIAMTAAAGLTEEQRRKVMQTLLTPKYR